MVRRLVRFIPLLPAPKALIPRGAIGAALALCGLLSFQPARAQVTSEWTAASNTYPDDLCPWTLFDLAPSADPVLNGGILTLATAGHSEYLYYEQAAANLVIPSLLLVEASLRIVSDSHEPSYRGTQIVVNMGSGRVNVIQIGVDDVILWTALSGAHVLANVDTDNAFHSYRIEMQPVGSVDVYQDNVLILSGTTINDGSFTLPAYIYWGDGTVHAGGTSQWKSFKHNASANPCDEPTPAVPTTWGAVKAHRR